jgi:acyl-coenzyme A synthetase/AMP-(fatty) acid ligase
VSKTHLPLTQLLAVGRPDDAVVAFGREGPRDFADLAGRVAGLVPAIRAAGPGRWLVYSEDTYACAVALLALSHAGASAVLPPNAGSGTLRRLRGDLAGGLVDPGIGHEALAGLPVLDPLARRAPPPRSWPRLDPGAPFADFSTSGTTGAGKSVGKALRHLADEVACLEARFGDALGGGTRIYATVSHQHVYGLLFRLLWPLAAGRPLCADTFLHAGELLPRMLRGGDCALVATPTHLKRMCSLPAFAKLRDRCRAIFSSGGPLDEETARGVAGALGAAPFEIFGSTETGGVAWRQRGEAPESALWTPFAPVAVARDQRDGRLVATSPFVSAGEEALPSGAARLAMGDRVELVGGSRFRLLGRADRDVKVGEKRLSLPEMEARLREHAYVSEVALAALEQASELRVHAALVPSEAGRAALREQGRREVGRLLAEHLALDWDRVLLPRAWRFVDELPRDAQGKATVELLAALFREEAARPRDPVREGEERGERWLARRLRVPPDLATLDGHFPGFPLVPGVVQVGWALDAARSLLGRAAGLRAVEALKFKDVLRPGDAFELRVELAPGGQRASFRLGRPAPGPGRAGEGDDERLFSSGRLCFAGREEAS